MVGDAQALITDFQSSGLNGSLIWSGVNHNARIYIVDLALIMKNANGTKTLLTLSQFKDAEIEGLKLIEEQDGCTVNAIDIFGCGRVKISGSAQCRVGTRIRASGHVEFDVSMRQVVPTPDTALSRVGPAATSQTGVTTVGAISAGDMSITLTGVTLVTGGGGFLRYWFHWAIHALALLRTGADSHFCEWEIRTSVSEDVFFLAVLAFRLAFTASRISGHLSTASWDKPRHSFDQGAPSSSPR